MTRHNTPSRLMKALAPPRPALRGFTAATLITSIDTGAYTAAAIVYFVHSPRLDSISVGAGLTLATGLGLAVSLPAGRLIDRIDAKPVLVGCFVLQAVLFALFPLINSFPTFLVAVIGASLGTSAAYPAGRVMLSDLMAGGPRVVAAAYNRSVLNVGVSVGALLAGGALAADSQPAYDAVFLGNAASFTVSALLLGRIKVAPQRRPRPPATRPRSRTVPRPAAGKG